MEHICTKCGLKATSLVCRCALAEKEQEVGRLKESSGKVIEQVKDTLRNTMEQLDEAIAENQKLRDTLESKKAQIEGLIGRHNEAVKAEESTLALFRDVVKERDKLKKVVEDYEEALDDIRQTAPDFGKAMIGKANRALAKLDGGKA